MSGNNKDCETHLLPPQRLRHIRLRKFSGNLNMDTDNSIYVNTASNPYRQPMISPDPMDTDEQNTAANPQLEVIRLACGDKAHLLDKLPYDKVKFEPHEDNVTMAGAGKTSSVVSVKFQVATDYNIEEDYRVSVWAYIFENSETIPTPRVAYVGLNRDNEPTYYSDRDLVKGTELADIFPTNCPTGMIGALVKFYFYKLGVQLPALPTFSKGNTEDIIRACSRFEKPNQNVRRAVRNSAPASKEVSESYINLTPRQQSPEPFSPTQEGFTMTSPGFTIQGDLPGTNDIDWSQASGYGNRDTFFTQVSQVLDQVSRYEQRLAGVVEAKQEEEKKVKALKQRAKEVTADLKETEVRLEKLESQELSAVQNLEAAKAARKNVLEKADRQSKMMLELGIKIGREENERKRHKSN